MEVRCRRLLLTVWPILILILLACGRAPSAGDGTTGQGTSSPNPTSSGSNPYAFAPGDCTYPSSGGTTLGPFGSFGLYVTVPSTWTQLDPGPVDLLGNGPYVLLRAPAIYGSGTTEIGIGRSGDVNEPYAAGASAAQVMKGQRAGQVQQAGGVANTCTVGGDSAAYVPVSNSFPRLGATSGFTLLWLHQGRVFALDLYGTDGPSPQAIEDAKAILGSVKWRSVSPSPSPTPSST